MVLIMMLPVRCVLFGQVQAFATGVRPAPLRLLLLAVVDVGVLHQKLVVVVLVGCLVV